MQLSAFTLMEMLVSMTIASIVIWGGFNAYVLLQKQYLLFRQTNETIYQYQAFHSTLLYDTFQAQYVECSEQNLFFIKDSLAINYHFETDKIIKQVSRSFLLTQSDTFYIQAFLEKAFFEKKIQLNGLADAYQVTVVPFQEQERFFFAKDYSASDLINYDENGY